MSTICKCLPRSWRCGPGSGASNLAWDPPNLQPWCLGPPDLCPSVQSVWQGFPLPQVSDLSVHTSASPSRLPSQRFFAQCVFWCRSEHLPLVFASNLFHTYVLPSVSWGAEDSVLGQLPQYGFWMVQCDVGSRCVLGWPRGSPVAAVHFGSGWLDAQRLIAGRLLSLFGRITFHTHRRLFSASSHCVSRPGSSIASCSDLCASLEIVRPSSFDVGPGCSVQRVREWFTQCC